MKLYEQQTTQYLEWLRDRLIEESSTNPHSQEIALKISEIIESRKWLTQTTGWIKPIWNVQCTWITVNITFDSDWSNFKAEEIPCWGVCWWACGINCKNL